MPSSSAIFIETTDVTRENLAGFLDRLGGCWKSSSLLWMQANALPILPGLITNEASTDAANAISRFCTEHRFSDLLLRIEKPNQRWTRRRGGRIVSFSSIAGLVSELAAEGLLSILLEPASPYADLYSLTAVCDLRAGRFDIEVVGPGFDASDVLRSDLTPHERFEGSLEPSSQRLAIDASRSYLVTPDAYRASVKRRLAKIGASLQNPNFPEEVAAPAEKLAEAAARHLENSGERLLLDHLAEYQPIQRSLFDEFARQLARIVRAARLAQVPWSTLSLAASFLATQRLVMWDFFTPESYETTVLSRMSAKN
jgi:hypothetical protein